MSNVSSFPFSDLLNWPSLTSGNLPQLICGDWWLVGEGQAKSLHGCLHKLQVSFLVKFSLTYSVSTGWWLKNPSPFAGLSCITFS